MELSLFNPYSGKFAGYNITKGKLTTELHYKVDGRNLDAEHHIIVDQLEFGDKTESKDAVSLPVKLAVALLKDRDGVIDLNLPVCGAPRSEVRWLRSSGRCIVNILEKAYCPIRVARRSVRRRTGHRVHRLPTGCRSPIPPGRQDRGHRQGVQRTTTVENRSADSRGDEPRPPGPCGRPIQLGERGVGVTVRGAKKPVAGVAAPAFDGLDPEPNWRCWRCSTAANRAPTRIIPIRSPPASRKPN